MQTWQQRETSHLEDETVPHSQDAKETFGTLDDLVEDCLNEQPKPACSGVNDMSIPGG